MAYLKKHTVAILLASGALFACGYYFALQQYLYVEVSWHIEAARRMLDGGNYVTNIFDDNPPMVYLIYAPLVLLSQLIGKLHYQLAYAYIFLLYAMGSIVIFKVCQKALSLKIAVYSFFFASLIATLFLGVINYGERECVMMLFLTPYIYTNLFNYKPSLKFGAAIALLAAIGIVQLPYFVIVLLALDGMQYFFREKRIQLYQYQFYFIALTFMLVFYILYPGYYSVILKYYVQAQENVNMTLTVLFHGFATRIVVACWLIASVATVTICKRLIYSKLFVILTIAIIIFFLQMKSWTFHLYPALFFCMLFGAVLMFDVLSSEPHAPNLIFKKIIMGIYSVLIFILLLVAGLDYMRLTQFYHGTVNSTYQFKQFYKTIPPHENTTLFFHTLLYPAYILNMYAGVHVISPWANNWLLLQGLADGVDRSQAHKDFLYHLVSSTIAKKHPNYIVYPASNKIPYIKGEGFNYLEFFKQDKQFARQLKQYHYLKKIDNFIILKKYSA